MKLLLMQLIPVALVFSTWLLVNHFVEFVIGLYKKHASNICVKVNSLAGG